MDTPTERPMRDICVEKVEVQIDALRDLMDERDRSYIERFSASERNVVTAMVAAEKAVTTAMTAAEKAVSTAMAASEKAGAKAEESANKQFDLMTTTVASRFASLEKHIADLQHQLTEFQSTIVGRHSGLSDAWGWLVGILGLAIGGLSVWFHSK
jgi:phage-related minor tail protein